VYDYWQDQPDNDDDFTVTSKDCKANDKRTFQTLT